MHNDTSIGFFGSGFIPDGKKRKKGELIRRAEDSGKGKISNSLSKAISYERTPDLFDTKEIQDRDRELASLLELKESDIKLCIDRKDKPIVLTSYQDRIIHGLAYAISQEADIDEDVIKKIQNAPFMGGGNKIERCLNITALTSLIFGSTRKRYKEIVIKELFTLARMRQVQILQYGDKKIKLTSPLIALGEAMEDYTPEKQSNLDFVEIIFGRAFFLGLNNRYAVITPKLFEVWGKKGRGTELFNILLSSMLSVYWSYKQAANKTEERVRSDKRYKTVSEREQAVVAARRNAMRYELNVSSIKKRVTTDYETERVYRAKFWKDLENAIEGFKELNLIDEASVQKGVKGQEKVVFILSDKYSVTIPEDEPILLGSNPNSDGEEEAAF